MADINKCKLIILAGLQELETAIEGKLRSGTGSQRVESPHRRRGAGSFQAII